MTVNGKQVAGGRLERTIPIQFSLGEGLDVGMDRGAPALDAQHTCSAQRVATREAAAVSRRAAVAISSSVRQAKPRRAPRAG